MADTSLRDLGTLGGTNSYGYDVNSFGQVAGVSDTLAGFTTHAFRYDGTPGSGGIMRDLATLGGQSNGAFAINDAGFIVGFASRAEAGTNAPALWRPDLSVVDLDAWLDAVNPTLGVYWALTEARGINNDGLITGQGTYDDGPGGLSDGYRAFVLDASSLTAAPQLVAGDFNSDTIVDADDLLAWKAGFGATGNATRTQGDADGDQDVDGADFLAWQRHLGATPTMAAATTSVPEPATRLLVVSGAFAMMLRRRVAVS